jgi:hypothetical protein
LKLFSSKKKSLFVVPFISFGIGHGDPGGAGVPYEQKKILLRSLFQEFLNYIKIFTRSQYFTSIGNSFALVGLNSKRAMIVKIINFISQLFGI